MTRRGILYIAIAFLVLATGCGPCHRLLLCEPGPCAVPVGCACGGGGRECGPSVQPWCGPVCGPSHPCYGRGLLGWLFALFRPHGAWCDGGCGERYWGGFLSDPPDCCDPCDRLGNWVGGVGAAGVGPVAAGAVGPVVPDGAMVGPDGCPDCLLPQARIASRLTPSRGLPPVSATPTAAKPIGPWPSGAEPGIITDPTSPYAPRLISVTDRDVAQPAPNPVQPAPPDSGEAPAARVAQSPQAAVPAVR